MNTVRNLRRRTSSLARLTCGNVFSLAYLALVATAMAYPLVESAFVEHPDASLSAVWLLLLTLPGVLLPLIAGAEGAVLYASVAVVALAQAALLGLFLRALRGSWGARPAGGAGARPAS